MSQFAALGLAGDEVTGFDALVHRAADEGVAEELGEDVSLVRWRPPAGAWLDLVVEEGEVACATPQWSAQHRRQVRVTGLAPDPDCDWCSVLVLEVLGSAGEVLHPLAVQPAGTAVLGPREGTVTEAGMVLVAEALHDAGTAPDGLLARGLDGGPPAAFALVVGTVTEAELRRPEEGPPHWVTTLDVGGRPWDLLAPADLAATALGGLVPGVRVVAGCWVCGEIGHPGGAGPDGVERREGRRWNWRP